MDGETEVVIGASFSIGFDIKRLRRYRRETMKELTRILRGVV